MRLLEYRASVIEFIGANFKGDVRQVRDFPSRFDLEAVKRVITPAPTVLISILGVPSMPLATDGRFDATISLAAYCVTKDEPLKPAADAALDLAMELAIFLSLRTFGVEDARPALVTRVDNLHTVEMAANGISISAVAFNQNVRLGRVIYAEDEFGEPLPENFDISQMENWPDQINVNEDNSPVGVLLGENDAP